MTEVRRRKTEAFEFGMGNAEFGNGKQKFGRRKLDVRKLNDSKELEGKLKPRLTI